MAENDREYYANRADQEYENGDRAPSPAIAAIHFDLAYRYALLSNGVGRHLPPMVFQAHATR